MPPRRYGSKIKSGGERSRFLLRPALFLKPLALYLLIVIILAVAFSVACGSGGGNNDAAATATEAPPPADANAIRQLDFANLPEIKMALAQLPGSILEKQTIAFADVTGDQREDAIVPLSSGGTLGNVAYVVLAANPGGNPKVVLRRTLDASSTSGIVMYLEDGKLIESKGIFGPEDPFCCPSKLRLTYFRWDGSMLQVEKEETVAGQTGKQ